MAIYSLDQPELCWPRKAVVPFHHAQVTSPPKISTSDHPSQPQRLKDGIAAMAPLPPHSHLRPLQNSFIYPILRFRSLYATLGASDGGIFSPCSFDLDISLWRLGALVLISLVLRYRLGSVHTVTIRYLHTTGRWSSYWTCVGHVLWNHKRRASLEREGCPGRHAGGRLCLYHLSYFFHILLSIRHERHKSAGSSLFMLFISFSYNREYELMHAKFLILSVMLVKCRLCCI